VDVNDINKTVKKTDAADSVSAIEPNGVVGFLATYPSDTYLDEAALAKGFSRSSRTIRRWEKERVLPPRTPGVRMWRVGNINSWFIRRAEEVEKPAREYLRQIEEVE
jgi:hypothetical protein